MSGEGGYFVSDSVLRRNEGSTLTKIISSHMPGLMQIHGVLVSSRKQCRGPALQGCSSPNCYVSIFVDNVLLYQARMAADHVPPPDLAKEFDVTEFAVGNLSRGRQRPGQHARQRRRLWIAVALARER